MLILGDVGAEHLTKTQQRAIVDFVETQGKPVIFLPSRNTLGVNGFGNTELAPLLPIDIPRDGCRVADTEFTVRLTQPGAFHPMLQLGDRQSTQTAQTALRWTETTSVCGGICQRYRDSSVDFVSGEAR